MIGKRHSKGCEDLHICTQQCIFAIEAVFAEIAWSDLFTICRFSVLQVLQLLLKSAYLQLEEYTLLLF